MTLAAGSEETAVPGAGISGGGLLLPSASGRGVSTMTVAVGAILGIVVSQVGMGGDAIFVRPSVFHS